MSRMAGEVFEAEKRARRIREGSERRRIGEIILCLVRRHVWIYMPWGPGDIKRFCVRCGTSEGNS